MRPCSRMYYSNIS